MNITDKQRQAAVEYITTQCDVIRSMVRRMTSAAILNIDDEAQPTAGREILDCETIIKETLSTMKHVAYSINGNAQ